jgi:hypothetical protein
MLLIKVNAMWDLDVLQLSSLFRAGCHHILRRESSSGKGKGAEASSATSKKATPDTKKRARHGDNGEQAHQFWGGVKTELPSVISGCI